MIGRRHCDCSRADPRTNRAKAFSSLPTIEGNVDYRNLRDQLVGMDELLRVDNAEEVLVQKRPSEWMARPKKPPLPKHQAKYQTMCRLAVRCNVARSLLGEE